ncbi:uncharacterized protein LOC126377096 [Pectinophora gossypiella]|uniref:uncharacterized protein LOC126377096 n=1 Tax=Pectinophora gossypiella TaxID=13191 RepID=UPI00214DFAC3|nr:uncharacterized protein LOC126377096 [Pectinophora gossypiella]
MDDNTDTKMYQVLVNTQNQHIILDIKKCYEEQTIFVPSQDLKATNSSDTYIEYKQESELNQFGIFNDFQTTQANTNQQEMVKIVDEVMSEDVTDEGIFSEPMVHVVRNKSQTSRLYASHIVPSTFIHDYTNRSKEKSVENSDKDYEQQSKKVLLVPVVLLENWGPRLESSSCYCKVCQILFPTSNTLQAHNVAEHTFLVPAHNIEPPKSKLKGIGHIIFQCKTCDIFYDTYDKAVEHCQNHLNDMANSIITKKCCWCDKKFDITCINKHRAIHAKSRKFKKDSLNFRTVTFDYTALFTYKWMDMFRDANISKYRIFSLTTRSIYFPNRDVKFRVVKDGPIDAVLFRCAKCERHVDPSTLTDHIIMDSCESERVYVCQLNNCGLRFCESEALWHTSQHQWSDTFKIVLFNEVSDKKFNETLKRHNTEALVRKICYFYRCTKCNCCTEIATDMDTHKCCYTVNRILCETCDLFFSCLKIYMRHKK